MRRHEISNGDGAAGAEDLHHYSTDLLAGRTRIGIWGLGHIGYSSMCHFASAGVKAIGVDVQRPKVIAMNAGEVPIPSMSKWLGFDPAPLFHHGLARATVDWQELTQGDVAVHLVCVPTERGDRPSFEALEDVSRKIATINSTMGSPPPLVIVESTLAPSTVDTVIVPILENAGLVLGRDVLVGVAPRRDWFTIGDKSLRSLPRVVGGIDRTTTSAIVDVLGIVCSNLLTAPDHAHAEIVKGIENAFRHMEIALANELSLAYPHLDMRKVLELVGTKWNVEEFYPSLGIGGYCIPLSSHYVMQGADRPEFLSLLQATISSSEEQPHRVARFLMERGNVRNVGILGLSYLADLKVSSNSPAIPIARDLEAAGIDVAVNDPYYSADEIRTLTGASPLAFPDELGGFDALIVVSGHSEYSVPAPSELLERVGECRLILDNTDIWRTIDFGAKGIEYRRPGDANWLDQTAFTNVV